MQAAPEELEILQKLNAIDMATLQQKRALDALPQRKTIAQLRAQIKTFEEKQEKVSSLRAQSEKKLSLAIDEDERLAKKQEEIQEALNSNAGGFRDVEARTKEMNGYAKRRSTLVDELSNLEEEAAKIADMDKKICAMIAGLKAKEAKEVAEFQDEGGKLQQKIHDYDQIHGILEGALSDPVRKAYQQAVAQCGGIGVSLLKGDSCSVCRTTIDFAHMAKVKKEAPLSQCPSCRRLLIVD